MGDREDYLTSYRVFFENFAATVNPEDQLPVHIAGYTITESELAGEVLYWTTQYLNEKQCPLTLMTPLRRIILDEVRTASKKQPNEFGYKSDESVYIALRLMQAVTARVNAVCLRYLDNSQLDTLPPPPPLPQRDLKTVSCAAKNSRRAMEDRHVEIGNLEALFGIDTTEPTSFYAVYDGHAGSAAATYCAAHLHQYLVESTHFNTDLQRALRDAFLRTDAEFIRKSNQERACGGSTAVCVCVRARCLLAAWAGDSLALLAKRMRLMQLVRPHKPGRQDERDRIESSGGTVMFWGTWRVNGQLAVSRAIGDAQYKPYVTARPEIATVDLDGDEDFVVVACDGLWDFVSEDEVALAVYRQLAADPDDLKAVTKRLIAQAKRQGSADNISIIVVFLKDPRDIVADNCPPMDLGLDNAMVNAPPFTIETEACKRQVDAATAAADAEANECADTEADVETGGNGVDNSDSDSEDLGPETAVDADDLDAEKNHEPQPPTPPAHNNIVEEAHVDGALVDNVAESGDESEDEWNYYKGAGEREEHDHQPRSETPCQDNSADSSSVDMNSSPLNPDAPVFVPGGVAGADVLLAESPRKPVPMDDIELPDVAQFDTGAGVRPAELLDLDNCDQLNGHHNVSDDDVKQHLNGNDKCNMDSLGFGFNVGIEPEKVKDSGLIQEFERIQKDTTDFCNIQVFQTQTETNPFAVEGNDELFERLKNKERDPMSMSFYQEKDDDTCERFSKNESHIDLNAVQPLPDSDDEDIHPNGFSEDTNQIDKENISPTQQSDLFTTGTDIQEPNNDIIMFDDKPGDLAHNLESFGQGDNFVDFNVISSNNMENYSNIEFECSNIPQDTIVQTDTPESHKLLFEQIPEIPDGKSSELGFTNDETQDPSESEKDVGALTPQEDTSQDVEMESKLEDLSANMEPQLVLDDEDHLAISHPLAATDRAFSPADVQHTQPTDPPVSPTPPEDTHVEGALTPESGVVVENADENLSQKECFEADSETIETDIPEVAATPEPPVIKLDTEHLTDEALDDDLPTESPAKSPTEAISPRQSPLPAESPVPRESPLPDTLHPIESPTPRDSPLPEELVPTESQPASESPLPSVPERESSIPRGVAEVSVCEAPPVYALRDASPRPTEEDLITEKEEAPRPVDVPLPRESPLPADSPLPAALHIPADTVPESTSMPTETLTAASPIPTESLPATSPVPTESLPATSPIPSESLPAASPIPTESLPTASPIPTEALPAASPIPTEALPTVSPIPTDALTAASPIPTESLPATSPIPTEALPAASPIPTEALPAASPIPTESLPATSPVPTEALPAASPIPTEAFTATSPILTETHPAASPIPTESLLAASPIPTESLPAVSPIPTETLPAASPIPTESFSAVSPVPAETLIADSSIPADSVSPAPIEALQPSSPVPVEKHTPTSPIPTDTIETNSIHAETVLSASPAPAASPIPTETVTVSHVSTETFAAASPVHIEEAIAAEETFAPVESTPAPAPDLLPEQPRSELVTDVDIGIPESRAQEICMPVTSEIQLEEAVHPPTAATPPPTPAVDSTASANDLIAPATEPASAPSVVPTVAAIAATAAASAVAAAATAKATIKSTTKKSPTTPTAKPDARTPKSAPRPTAARTPGSGVAAKRPTPTTPAARTPTSKTATSTTKTPTSAAKAPAAKPPTPAARPAAKPMPPATRPTAAAKPTSPTKAPISRPAPITRPALTKPTATAPKPATTKAPATTRVPATTRPATKAPVGTKPTTTRTDATAAKPALTRPAPRAAPASKPAPKPIEKKPLPNGDVKEMKTSARPATAPRAAARPAPAPARPAVPKSAPAPRVPLDKQSKDLANKRITAKAAPPRTAPAKTTLGVKKAVPHKGSDATKPSSRGALANGSAGGKAPPSPPPADNALLPDVIA